MSQFKRLEVLAGKICPQEQTVSLLFDLESNVFSPSSQSLDIPIKPTNVEVFQWLQKDDFRAGSEVSAEQAQSE